MLGARYAIWAIATVQFGSASYSEREGDRYLVLSVTRSDASRTATVEFITHSGTAVAGTDFTAKSQTLLFLAGQKTSYVSVPILADRKNERAETFSAVLRNPTGMSLGSPKKVVVTIADDD